MSDAEMLSRGVQFGTVRIQSVAEHVGQEIAERIDFEDCVFIEPWSEHQVDSAI
jgi:hypothetical protein